MILTRVAPHDHHALVLHVLGPQLEPERDALELPVVVLPARGIVQAAVGHHLRRGRRERGVIYRSNRRVGIVHVRVT